MTKNPKTIVEEGYDRVAEAYSRLESGQRWPRMKWLGKVLSRLNPGSAVLDLGCGSGDPADIEIARFHQVTGVDISNAQVEMAVETSPKVGSSTETSGHWNSMMGLSMPWCRSIPWSTFPESSMGKYWNAFTTGFDQEDCFCSAPKSVK